MARASLTQAEIARALKAAQDAGVTVLRYEVMSDRVVVHTSTESRDSADDVLDNWKRRNGTA